ncbi:MAG: twin-arginine translocation signal domain-containing protein, partial [Planctomycetota bacterium]
MKRRDFLKLGGAAAAASAAGCGNDIFQADPNAASTRPDTVHAPAIHSGKHHRWQLALFVPDNWSIWGEGIHAFAKLVAE